VYVWCSDCKYLKLNELIFIKCILSVHRLTVLLKEESARVVIMMPELLCIAATITPAQSTLLTDCLSVCQSVSEKVFPRIVYQLTCILNSLIHTNKESQSV